MTFDEWFDKEGYDDEHRFVFGLAWNAGMKAAGETGLDVDAPIRKEADRYRWLRDKGSSTWVPFTRQWNMDSEHCDAAIDNEMTTQRLFCDA